MGGQTVILTCSPKCLPNDLEVPEQPGRSLRSGCFGFRLDLPGSSREGCDVADCGSRLLYRTEDLHNRLAHLGHFPVTCTYASDLQLSTR